MSMSLGRKKIRCLNCGYEGKSKLKGTGVMPSLYSCGFILAALIFTQAMILFLGIAIVLFAFAVFRPMKHLCPDCGSTNLAKLRKPT